MMNDETVQARQAQVKMRPTLLVGLGGTGQKVLVSGAVVERGGRKQINVLDYTLIPENPDY